ncbi:MAG: hypothetical protein J1E82_03690 [Muribaculaceae bacterium]|nr:hypothetical protein [Muribaculaceae bacterium]
MKKRYYFILGLAALCMTACGGKTESESDSETSEVEENVEIIDPYKETSEDLSNPGEEISATEIESEESTDTSVASNSGKIDEYLGDLDKLVKECSGYISQLKSGKIDASKVMTVVDKAQSLKANLESMKDEMSAAQLSKLSGLVSKLSSVSSSISNIDAKEIMNEATEAVKEKATEKVKEKTEVAKEKATELVKKIPGLN